MIDLPDIGDLVPDVELSRPSLDGATAAAVGAIVGLVSLAAGSLKAAVMWVVNAPMNVLGWLIELPGAVLGFVAAIPGTVMGWTTGLLSGAVPSVGGAGSVVGSVLSVVSGGAIGGLLADVGLAPLVAAGVVVALAGYSWRKRELPNLGYTAQLAIWFAGGYVLVTLLVTAGVL